jgi:hypothetical protein
MAVWGSSASRLRLGTSPAISPQGRRWSLTAVLASLAVLGAWLVWAVGIDGVLGLPHSITLEPGQREITLPARPGEADTVWVRLLPPAGQVSMVRLLPDAGQRLYLPNVRFRSRGSDEETAQLRPEGLLVAAQNSSGRLRFQPATERLDLVPEQWHEDGLLRLEKSEEGGWAGTLELQVNALALPDRKLEIEFGSRVFPSSNGEDWCEDARVQLVLENGPTWASRCSLDPILEALKKESLDPRAFLDGQGLTLTFQATILTTDDEASDDSDSDDEASDDSDPEPTELYMNVRVRLWGGDEGLCNPLGNPRCRESLEERRSAALDRQGQLREELEKISLANRADIRRQVVLEERLAAFALREFQLQLTQAELAPEAYEAQRLALIEERAAAARALEEELSAKPEPEWVADLLEERPRLRLETARRWQQARTREEYRQSLEKSLEQVGGEIDQLNQRLQNNSAEGTPEPTREEAPSG